MPKWKQPLSQLNYNYYRSTNITSITNTTTLLQSERSHTISEIPIIVINQNNNNNMELDTTTCICNTCDTLCLECSNSHKKN